MSNWSRLKRTWNFALVLKLFKRFLKVIALAYIYQLAKFGGLMSCGSKDPKMHPVSCTTTHHDITDLINHGMVKNTKTCITFLQNEKILNLCLRWHIFRSYCFVAEVTFTVTIFSLFLVFQWSVNYAFFRYNRKLGK